MKNTTILALVFVCLGGCIEKRRMSIDTTLLTMPLMDAGSQARPPQLTAIDAAVDNN